MQTALIQIDPPKILAMHRKPTRVKSGEVVGVVPGTAVVPVVELDRPECDHRTHRANRLDPVAHADRVEIAWELVQHPNETIIESIKQRAGEVIVSRYSQTAQLNMLADAQLVAAEESPTAAMAARLDTYRAAYAWIKTVRAKSDELESALIDGGALPDFAALEVPFE